MRMIIDAHQQWDDPDTSPQNQEKQPLFRIDTIELVSHQRFPLDYGDRHNPRGSRLSIILQKWNLEEWRLEMTQRKQGG